MTRARLLIAGLTVIGGMTVTNASAQDCPEWLKWACSDTTSSDSTARKGGQQSRRQQLSRTNATSDFASGGRTKQARPAGADTAASQSPQRTQAPKPAPPAKAAGHTGGRDSSSNRRLARYGERQGTRPDIPMNDQEKEALFQQFLEWEKARRLNNDSHR
jgi:hypothetical protein